MTVELSFTEKFRCEHCQNPAPMSILYRYTQGISNYPDSDSSKNYELLLCPACNDVSLRSCYWDDSMDASEVTYTSLYPQGSRVINGLPQKVERAYEAARKVRGIDANAYGVLLGRVLDIVCDDRGASGNTLDEKLKNLAETAEIPEKLVKVASGLRQFRNIAAHANLGELTTRELPVLDDLTRAILDYVYSAPYLANLAAERFSKLKRPRTPKVQDKPENAEPSLME